MLKTPLISPDGPTHKTLFGNLVTVIAASVLAITVTLTLVNGVGPHSVSEQAVPYQQKNRVLPTQNLRFTLYPQGIYPRKATAHKGPISILIEDLTDGRSTLLIQHLTGNDRVTAGQIRRSEKSFRGRATLDLKPGNYRLSIAERPTAEAELVVVP